MLSTQTWTKPIAATASFWAGTSQSPEIGQATTTPSHPKPVPIHPSHHTASRMRNPRCKQQIQSNAHSLVSLTPRATLRTRSSPAWLAVVKFPVRHTVWSITSRDDHSRQPSGPSCKRFKTTALHNVTTTRASHAEHHVAERPAHSPSSSLLVPRVFSGLVPAHPA